MNDETRKKLLELLAPHIKAVQGSWVQHPGGIPGGIGQRVDLELSEDGTFRADVVTDCVQSVDKYYRIVGKLNKDDTLEDVKTTGPFYD